MCCVGLWLPSGFQMGFMLELLSLLFMISVFLSLCSSSSTALVDDVFLFCSFFFVFACFLCLCQVLVFESLVSVLVIYSFILIVLYLVLLPLSHHLWLVSAVLSLSCPLLNTLSWLCFLVLEESYFLDYFLLSCYWLRFVKEPIIKVTFFFSFLLHSAFGTTSCLPHSRPSQMISYMLTIKRKGIQGVSYSISECDK